MALLERIDISEIITGHFGTLYDARTNKPYWQEIITFYLVPLILFPLLAWYFNFTVEVAATDMIIQTFAIAGGFLVSALFIIVDRNTRTEDKDVIKPLLEETYLNVSFGVLVCFLTVIFCLLNHLCGTLKLHPIDATSLGTLRDYLSVNAFSSFVGGIVSYLCWIFVYNMLMILKRLNKIFKG